MRCTLHLLPWVDAGPMAMNINCCHSNNWTNQERTKNDNAESRMAGWDQKNHTGHNKALHLNWQHPRPNHTLESNVNINDYKNNNNIGYKLTLCSNG